MTPLVQDARISQPVVIRGEVDRTVQGFVYGLWAVTPCPMTGDYRVTHIATGLSATMFESFPLPVARKIARRYRDELDDEFWSSGDVVPSEVPAAEERKVRRILAEAETP